jgi:hypothetical protein
MVFSPLINSITGLAANAQARLSGASQIISGGTTGTSLGSGANAVSNVINTIDGAKADANKQRIMAAVSLRIQGIADGIIQPQEVWEKVAGFLAITGQPFTYSVDDQGQIDVQPQSLDDLSNVPPGQQNAMRQALERLDEIRTQVDTVNTKANLRSKLIVATARVDELDKLNPPREQWERDFNLYRSQGRPVLVGLDPNGNLRAIDQLASDFSYVEDASKRALLQGAARDLDNIIAGRSTATESWQFEALGNKLDGDDYFLDVDNNNEIVVRRNRDRRGVSAVQPLFQQAGNTDFHIIPEFLKETREDSRIFRDRWESEAAALFQAKRPFHLEIVGDRVVVRETNFATARRQDLLNVATGGNAKVGAATVNILS